MTHPHDPYEKGGVAYEEEADGEVVEQGLWKPGLEEEGTSQLSQRLRSRFILLVDTSLLFSS